MHIDNTLFIGKVFHHFDRLSSTNDYALQLLSEGAVVEGTVIATDDQYLGRGQMGNTWKSHPGENITMSIILKPCFLPAAQQFYLNMAVSLAVRATVAMQLHEEVFIKWSNDTLVNKKKVAGILIQNQLSGQQLQSSVIGIGINVNQRTFSPDLKQASSLSLLSGNRFAITNLQTQLCQHLERYYLLLRQGKMQLLRQEYLTHLWQYQQWAMYQLPYLLQPIHGRIIDVTDNGTLVVEHPDHQATYGFKEIQFVL